MTLLTTRICAAALCLMWLSPVAAQPAPAIAYTEAVDPLARRGFMWEARKDGQLVLLMGTIHVGKAGFQPPRESFVARLKQAEVVAVEVDVSSAERIGPIVRKIAFYGTGSASLGERYPQLQAPLEEAAQRFNLAPLLFMQMKPWMAANTLGLIETGRAGYSSAQSTESFLFDFVRDHRKDLVEVENIEEQLRLFDAAPESIQLAYLQRVLRTVGDGSYRKEFARVVGAWERGDATEMEKLVERMRAATGEAERYSYEALMIGRHPHMLAAIERFAASGRLHVVALGSMHFFGDRGLLKMLRQRGYAITPV